MKEFNIFERKDFNKMVDSFNRFFDKQERDGKKFQKIKVISKRYVKPKSSKQHRKYWSCINELKLAFLDVGYVYGQEEIHEFIKKKAGFTKEIILPNGEATIITKSIADLSDDVNSKNIAFLINFIIEFASINLNYAIHLEEEDGRS